MFEFTEEALHLVTDYVQNVQRKIGDIASDENFNRIARETFLSDIEDDIKFLAIGLSMERKVNVVDADDVKRALRN